MTPRALPPAVSKPTTFPKAKHFDDLIDELSKVANCPEPQNADLFYERLVELCSDSFDGNVDLQYVNRVVALAVEARIDEDCKQSYWASPELAAIQVHAWNMRCMYEVALLARHADHFKAYMDKFRRFDGTDGKGYDNDDFRSHIQAFNYLTRGYHLFPLQH
jgi:hypothetical protein